MTGKCICKNITKPEINFVLISLCTCKRPKMLKNALKSIENIICPENIKIEVLVVDNDINKTAQEIVNKFQENSKYIT